MRPGKETTAWGCPLRATSSRPPNAIWCWTHPRWGHCRCACTCQYWPALPCSRRVEGSQAAPSRDKHPTPRISAWNPCMRSCKSAGANLARAKPPLQRHEGRWRLEGCRANEVAERLVSGVGSTNPLASTSHGLRASQHDWSRVGVWPPSPFPAPEKYPRLHPHSLVWGWASSPYDAQKSPHFCGLIVNPGLVWMS